MYSKSSIFHIRMVSWFAKTLQFSSTHSSGQLFFFFFFFFGSAGVGMLYSAYGKNKNKRPIRLCIANQQITTSSSTLSLIYV